MKGSLPQYPKNQDRTGRAPCSQTCWPGTGSLLLCLQMQQTPRCTLYQRGALEPGRVPHSLTYWPETEKLPLLQKMHPPNPPQASGNLPSSWRRWGVGRRNILTCCEVLFCHLYTEGCLLSFSPTIWRKCPSLPPCRVWRRTGTSWRGRDPPWTGRWPHWKNSTSSWDMPSSDVTLGNRRSI